MGTPNPISSKGGLKINFNFGCFDTPNLRAENPKGSTPGGRGKHGVGKKETPGGEKPGEFGKNLENPLGKTRLLWPFTKFHFGGKVPPGFYPLTFFQGWVVTRGVWEPRDFGAFCWGLLNWGAPLAESFVGGHRFGATGVSRRFKFPRKGRLSRGSRSSF